MRPTAQWWVPTGVFLMMLTYRSCMSLIVMLKNPFADHGNHWKDTFRVDTMSEPHLIPFLSRSATAVWPSFPRIPAVLGPTLCCDHTMARHPLAEQVGANLAFACNVVL